MTSSSNIHIPGFSQNISEIQEKIRQTAEKQAILVREMMTLQAELNAAHMAQVMAGADPGRVETPSPAQEISGEVMREKPNLVSVLDWRKIFLAIVKMPQTFAGADLKAMVPLKETRYRVIKRMVELGWLIKEGHGIWAKAPSFPPAQ